jgi:hypothetical protein
LEGKLAINIDYFADDYVKMVYIKGRLGRRANDNITPYLDAENNYYLETSIKLIAYLKAIYSDPNKKEDADEK